MEKFDVVIIGAGPGGYAAALRAASNGSSVALIEKDKLGGACLNRGCIPAKSWIAAAETVEHAKLLHELAVNPFEYELDYAKVVARHRKIVAQFGKSLGALLKKSGVKLYDGEGRFTSPNQINVAGPDGVVELTFDNAIIATGSRSVRLFDVDSPHIITSESLFTLNSLPKSLLIVGAGAIGCELAGFMVRMGVGVTMVEMMPGILPMEDHDISATMEREFKKLKVKIIKGARITAFDPAAKDISATLDNGDTITADKMLVSVGREYATDGLGLESAGVEVNGKGAIMTDENMKTSVSGIYAVGDVAGRNMLAYTAYREGAFAADRCAGRKDVELEETAVPSVVFTIPEIGSVGLTEEKAPDNARVGIFMFRGLARAHATGEITGFVKIIADHDSDRLLGAHIIGPRATDMIHILSIALSTGMTARQVGSLLFAHPTFAEAIVEAVHDIHGESLHK